MSEVLLDPTAIDLALQRMAAEIVERGRSSSGVIDAPVLVGIRRGGEPFARRLSHKIGALIANADRSGRTTVESSRPPVGAVDITLYRDDAATALPNPRIGPSRIPVSIDKRRVILVDDVILTGRTIRAAFDALFDFGRPSRVELATLIDRGGRELPIQPDYVGQRTTVPDGRRVEVILKRLGPNDDDDEPWALLVPAK